MQHKFVQKLALLVLSLIAVVACDKDFNEIGTDIVGGDNDHYLFEKYTGATLKAYNQRTGAVASQNLAVNPLGIYKNSPFGTTTANFVTQLELGTLGRDFNNVDPSDYDVNPTIIDSVILSVPYFSNLEDVDSDGNRTYTLDSIYPKVDSNLKFDLAVYESNYFLRDLDPSLQFTEQQSFYTDMNSEIDSYKNPLKLNDDSDVKQNTQFFFSEKQIIEKTLNDDGEDVFTRSTPGIRMKLNKNFFTQKILNAPSGKLETNAIFKNYFRGLYFKVQSNGNEANMAMLNFKGGKVTIYYNEDKKTTTNNVDTFERVFRTLVLNMSGNTVSLLENTNENSEYTAASNSASESEKIYLKGGEGALAIVDIFGPDNNGNGIADEIEAIKNNGWLINEANLTFYIDRTKMQNTSTIEPDRIFVYDYNNNLPLIDYSRDGSTNGSFPKKNKFVHGGIIEKEDIDGGRGIKYKVRITNHVRNLIQKDCTNVRLGVSVTENINSALFSKLKNPNGSFKKVPTMSVMSPLGTVLYGSAASVPEANRLKLEIYYTKPE